MTQLTNLSYLSFNRQAFIRKLMEKVRFPLMPPRDLMVHVNVVDFMRAKCNDLLLEVSVVTVTTKN